MFVRDILNSKKKQNNMQGSCILNRDVLSVIVRHLDGADVAVLRHVCRRLRDVLARNAMYAWHLVVTRTPPRMHASYQGVWRNNKGGPHHKMLATLLWVQHGYNLPLYNRIHQKNIVFPTDLISCRACAFPLYNWWDTSGSMCGIFVLHNFNDDDDDSLLLLQLRQVEQLFRGTVTWRLYHIQEEQQAWNRDDTFMRGMYLQLIVRSTHGVTNVIPEVTRFLDTVANKVPINVMYKNTRIDVPKQIKETAAF